MHEASLHDASCFLTLTYSDEALPVSGSLNKKHFQDFMKRLRKARPGSRIRYFHCGEYGETTHRPHYHALLFGEDFARSRRPSPTQGNQLWRSEELDRLWGHGHCSIGAVSFQSAAYVARYVMKKVTGEAAEAHYRRIDPETGEVHELLPEYITMSLKPGIGQEWFDRFGTTDVFPQDFIALKGGGKAKVPRYYDKQLPEDELRDIKARRIAAAHTPERKWDSTPQRLQVRETVKQAQVSFLKRDLK